MSALHIGKTADERTEEWLMSSLCPEMLSRALCATHYRLLGATEADWQRSLSLHNEANHLLGQAPLAMPQYRGHIARIFAQAEILNMLAEGRPN